MEETLKQIFEKYKGIPKTTIDGFAAEWGGDKGSAHSYIESYEYLFDDIRHSNIKLLEIGVLYGSSIKMWRDYFTNGEIYGMDILEKCKKYEEDRIKIIICDSTNENLISKLFYNMKFNIIIDDGHHDLDKQISTFNNLFKYVEKSGCYIIEDIQNIDRDKEKIFNLHKNVNIIDLRYKKNKYDDVLAVIYND